ncbi:MAG: DUF4412 domain-containing protein [Brevinematia bacterium]
MRAIAEVIFLVFIIGNIALCEEFEGIIVYKFLSKDITNIGKVLMKKQKMKMIPEKEITETNKGYPIIDFESKKGIFISTTDKYYMELPLEIMIKNVENNPITPKEAGIENYLNINTKKYLYHDKEYTIEALATEDIKPGLNPFIGIQRLGEEGLLVSKISHFFYQNNMLPLRIIVKNKNGETLISIQAISISSEKINNREFEIPQGYIKLSEIMKEKAKRSK